jgi:hypothetical protein
MADESKSERNRTIVMCFLAAVAVIFMSIGILIPHDLNSPDDIKNWAAIFIEAGIAVFITGVVYYVSNKQQSRINELTKQIKTMVETQQEFLKEQKEFQEKRRSFFHNMIRAYLSIIRHEIEEYDIVKMNLGMNLIPNDQNLLKSKCDSIEQDLKNITFQLTFASDVLEPHHVEGIRHLLAITDQYVKQQPSHNAQHHGIIGNIDLLLEELPNPPV